MPPLPPSTRAPSRLVLVTPFVLMFGAVAACCVAWGVERGQVLEALDAAPAAVAAHGGVLTLGERSVSGFPLRLRVRFASARIAGARGWAAEAPGLVAQAYVFQPRKWVVVAPQGVTLLRPQGGPLAISGDALRASVSGLGGAAWRFAVEADGARFAAPPGARFSLQSARRVEADAKPSATPGETDVLLQVEGGVATPESAVWHVASGAPFDLALTGRVAPRTFALERLEAKAGPTIVSSSGGELHAGDDGRLVGAVPLSVRQNAGRAPAPPGALSAVVIDRAAQAGSRLDLVFADGKARLGPFKLGPSPRVAP